MVMYENLEVHTLETLAAGEAAVERFGALMNVIHNKFPSLERCESNVPHPEIHLGL
jgi:hypothetical protein